MRGPRRQAQGDRRLVQAEHGILHGYVVLLSVSPSLFLPSVASVCQPSQGSNRKQNEGTNEHRLPIPLACLMTFPPSRRRNPRARTAAAAASAAASRGKK